MQRVRLGTLALVAALAPAGCRSPGDPIRGTLEALRHAAEERDAAAVSGLLAADFRAETGEGRAEIEATLARLFAAYERVSISLEAVEIERSESAARARFRVGMSGNARKLGGLEGLLPARASFRFDTRLGPEAGKWKIARASWERLE